MDKKEQIRQGLIGLASAVGPLQTVLAVVESVDFIEATCVLDDEGVTMYDVRLKPVLTGNEALVIFPAVGSWVLATRLEDDDDWLVIACEKADMCRFAGADCVIEMDSAGVKISKGGETLKAILSDLLTAIKALTVPTGTGPSGTPINSPAFTAIENRLNNFLK